MKYKVLEAHFKGAITALGSSLWNEVVKQGGYVSCYIDTDEQLLTLVPGKDKPALKKRTIHVSNTSDMVLGVTLSNKLQD